MHRGRGLLGRESTQPRLRRGKDLIDPTSCDPEMLPHQRLAPGYRAVLVLHDLEGYTHSEIARVLGIEPGTSKSQLARARQFLRDRGRRQSARETS